MIGPRRYGPHMSEVIRRIKWSKKIDLRFQLQAGDLGSRTTVNPENRILYRLIVVYESVRPLLNTVVHNVG